MKMRAVVEIWLKSLIDEFTLGGLHSAMVEGELNKNTNDTNKDSNIIENHRILALLVVEAELNRLLGSLSGKCRSVCWF